MPGPGWSTPDHVRGWTAARLRASRGVDRGAPCQGAVLTGAASCPGCGLLHEPADLDRPQDLLASGECAQEYAAAASCFYADPGLVPLRQHVVDAYACQHPLATTRRGVQTTALCLMTLDLVVECGLDVALGSALHQEMVRTRPAFVALPAPDLSATLTYRHLDSAASPQARGRQAREWAESVWQAWAAHHAQVRRWNQLLVPHRLG